MYFLWSRCAADWCNDFIDLVGYQRAHENLQLFLKAKPISALFFSSLVAAAQWRFY